MKRASQGPTPVPGGAVIFQRLYTRLGCHGRPPRFEVEFYPYANLMHTIRMREEMAYVRLSDALRGAPLPVFEAAAAILLSRVYRRRAPREILSAYRQFAVSPRTRRRVARLRRARGRRVQTGPRGDIYDLAPMFTRLNRRYFGGRLHRPRLGWSSRTWRAQFGCFDPALDQIVMNRWLDRLPSRNMPSNTCSSTKCCTSSIPLRAARCGIEAHSLKFQDGRKTVCELRARAEISRSPTLTSVSAACAPVWLSSFSMRFRIFSRSGAVR